VWTKKGNGGIYADGEELIINFYSNKDCFIKIYHIDINKKMSLIFPNQYHKTNFIKKGEIYKIPDATYPFSFVLGKPYGTEFIKVIASTVQFKEIEEPFKDMGTGTEGFVERGLSVERKKDMITESMISYTILAK